MIVLPINLQLFSEDDEDFEDDVDLDEEEAEIEDDVDPVDEEDIPEDEEEIEDEPEDKKPAKKDKVTHALIKQKQANKELKQELERFKQKEREEELKSKRKQVADKYIEKGYDENEAFAAADKDLEDESIKATVKKLEFMTENADVLAKYPEAKKNVNKLIQLQKATGWDIEKICRVEFDSNNAYDSRIKSEQETQLKKKRRTVTPAGGQTPIQSIKLDPDDERAYQFYAKKNPGISRKQYQEKINNRNQNIPHDRWED